MENSDEMTATVLFDGEVLRLESPIELEPNARYTILLRRESSVPSISDAPAKTAWDLLEELAGTIDAPPDWSEEHDHYIHGAPKRSEQENA